MPRSKPDYSYNVDRQLAKKLLIEVGTEIPRGTSGLRILLLLPEKWEILGKQTVRVERLNTVPPKFKAWIRCGCGREIRVERYHEHKPACYWLKERETLVELMGIPAKAFTSGLTAYWTHCSKEQVESLKKMAKKSSYSGLYANPEKVVGGQKYTFCHESEQNLSY